MAGNLQGIGWAGIVIKDGLVVRSGPKGCTTSFKAQCLTLPPLVSYYQDLIAGGAEVTAKGFDLGVDGTTSSEEKWLEVTFPGLPSSLVGVISEWFMDSWEMMTNENTDSIFANPLIVGTPTGSGNGILNYNDKVVLQYLAINNGTIAQAVASANSDVTSGNLTAPTSGNGGTAGGKFQTPGTAASNPGKVTQLTLEIKKGQVEDLVPTHVLRHTSYCSAGASYNSTRNNELKIYTTAKLLTEVGSGWNYNLPPRLYSEILTFPQLYAAVDEAPYYTWGWLKKIGREPVQADFMVEASVEYELGLWSNLRYGLAT